MKTPEPPDPADTAKAQAGMNRDTAITQQQLNLVNQVGPTGKTTYTQTGNNSFVDSRGRTVYTPKYTQTTTYTPAQQKIFNDIQKAQGSLAGLASQQSSFLKNYLAKPFDWNTDDAEKWALDLGSKRLDPIIARNNESTITRLKNSGIREGSAAWDAEMGRMDQGRNDAYNQLILGGRQQAFNEALTKYQLPINTVTSLMSGTQLQAPTAGQGGAAPQTGVAGVDYTGLVNQQYQAKVQNQQNMMGGLFGLASAGIGLFSDRRLKKDIEQVGVYSNGLPIYEFHYIWQDEDEPLNLGFMSDDVKEIMPGAVIMDDSGYEKVDYEMATRVLH